jgi:hypothetical protein
MHKKGILPLILAASALAACGKKEEVPPAAIPKTADMAQPSSGTNPIEVYNVPNGTVTIVPNPNNEKLKCLVITSNANYGGVAVTCPSEPAPSLP